MPNQPESASGIILVVDDAPANCKLLRDALEPDGHEVLLAMDGPAALSLLERVQADLILLDVMLPGMDGFEVCRRCRRIPAHAATPVLFITALQETSHVLEGFRAGGDDYITKPFRMEEVLVRVRTHLDRARLTRLLRQSNQELAAMNTRLQEEISGRRSAEQRLQIADDQLSLLSELEAQRWGIDFMAGRSPTLERILQQIRKVQPFESTAVLITGESGTGKELIARAIHFGGRRHQGPFLPVNCAAIPAELADSLFFGHLRGAFSGATSDRKGYFDNAEGGTLFLDEIGDLPSALQPKLLRAIETGRILPLGAPTEHAVRVRIIAATNVDLPQRTADGSFRKDLYYRLARFVIESPALRERSEDIPLLARHFIQMLASEMGCRPPEITPAALEVLQSYDFPGNIRELKNLMERALIESGGAPIEPIHLPFIEEAGLASDSRPRSPLSTENLAVVSTVIPPTVSESEPAMISPDPEAVILRFVSTSGHINNSACRKLLGVSMHRAWYLLRKLHQKGSLVQAGSGRWAEYTLP